MVSRSGGSRIGIFVQILDLYPNEPLLKERSLSLYGAKEEWFF
jgi:hypothetical protein